MPLDKCSAGLGAVNRHENGGDSKNSTSNGPNRPEQANSTSTGQTKCSVCQSTFRRPEHLKRHFRSHTKEKPFECAQCGRHFSRTDTLHRHEISHHTLGPEGGKDRAHRITVKTFRACFKCAIARVRCSGGSPCIRCTNRSLECEYPTERRSKAKARKKEKGSPKESPANDTESDPQQSRAFPSRNNADHTPFIRAGVHRSSMPMEHQTSQFQLQLTGRNDASLSHEVLTNQGRQHDSQKPYPEQREDRRFFQTESHSLLPNDSESTGVTNIPNAMEPQQAFSNTSTSTTQEAFPDSEAFMLDQPIKGLQPGIVRSNIDINMANAEGNQLRFDQPFFDHTMPSAVNWLSNDLFENASTKDSSFASRPPHVDHTGSQNAPIFQTAWPPPVINAGKLSPSMAGENSLPSSGVASVASEGGTLGQSNYTSGKGSHLKTGSSSKRQADHSAESTGPRSSKYRRRPSSWTKAPANAKVLLSCQNEDDASPRFLFPVIDDVQANKATNKESFFDRRIELSMYEQIHEFFLRLCCAESILYRPFDSDHFPTAETLSRFANCYFDVFQPVYPIFHSPTFDPNECHWLVTLAVCSIGCHVTKFPEFNEYSVAFDEFLRRAINVEKEKRLSDKTPLWLLQVMVLNCIGLLYNSGERAKTSALNSFGDLVTFTNRERLLHLSTKPKILSNEPSSERKWEVWIEDEVKRRTGYLIWLMDCTIAYNFDSKPLFCLDDVQASLPSHERLWQVESAEAWGHLLPEFSVAENVSLYDAVHIIYIEKRPVSGMGNFSEILLIHALYHRMWEVSDYFRRPLSFWNPTSKKQSRESVIPSGSVWLPGIPSYSKWRNSACDCLDILHWTANSSATKAGGFEHPAILHLHIARIVLLTPFREIRSLAISLATEKVRWGEHQHTLEWQYMLRWIKHDSYKARLAVVHAGATLWHVRQYSTHAFHEPMAVFLAVLILWAYGLCHPIFAQDAGLPRVSRSDLPSINFDQPCDDRLIQVFVREGRNMRGDITGVGDLCAPRGPERTLRVGCEALASLDSWGIAKRFKLVFAKLAEST